MILRLLFWAGYCATYWNDVTSGTGTDFSYLSASPKRGRDPGTWNQRSVDCCWRWRTVCYPLSSCWPWHWLWPQHCQGCFHWRQPWSPEELAGFHARDGGCRPAVGRDTHPASTMLAGGHAPWSYVILEYIQRLGLQCPPKVLW